jgi:hypothetical protein
MTGYNQPDCPSNNNQTTSGCDNDESQKHGIRLGFISRREPNTSHSTAGYLTNLSRMNRDVRGNKISGSEIPQKE